LNGSYPSYFVYGPLVFSQATDEFISGLSRAGSGGFPSARLFLMGSPLMSRMFDEQAFEGEQLVVVSSPFFPHKLAKGYSNPAAEVIKTLNGKPVKNLVDLVAMLRDCRDEFLTIEYDDRHGGETMVFPRAEMLAATDSILTDNGIRSQGSPDLMAIWNGKNGDTR
jgi:hypothetical protein